MGKRARRNQNGTRRSGTKQINSNHAGTMNGMQQVANWNLLDYQPLSAAQPFDTAQPVVVEFYGGVNGWGYSLRQGSTLIGNGDFDYGGNTGQFSELAQLWSTYRNDGLRLEWVPANTGAGYHSPVATCVDPAGETAAIGQSDYVDLLATFSRLRSFKLNPAIGKSAHLAMDYRQWVMQTCPQSFLLTVDPQSSTGERVFYPESSSNTAPVLRMSGLVVIGPGISDRTPIGFVRVCARFSVRGRRGLPLPSPNGLYQQGRQQQHLAQGPQNGSQQGYAEQQLEESKQQAPSAQGVSQGQRTQVAPHQAW